MAATKIFASVFELSSTNVAEAEPSEEAYSTGRHSGIVLSDEDDDDDVADNDNDDAQHASGEREDEYLTVSLDEVELIDAERPVLLPLWRRGRGPRRGEARARHARVRTQDRSRQATTVAVLDEEAPDTHAMAGRLGLLLVLSGLAVAMSYVIQ